MSVTIVSSEEDVAKVVVDGKDEFAACLLGEEKQFESLYRLALSAASRDLIKKAAAAAFKREWNVVKQLLEELHAGSAFFETQADYHFLKARIAIDYCHEADEPIKFLEKALKINSKHSLAHAYKAYIYSERNELILANSEATLAIHYDPENALAYIIRAKNYLYSQHTDVALLDVTVALRKSPNFHWAHFVGGMVLHQRSEFRAAIPLFEKANQLYPSEDSRVYIKCCKEALERQKTEAESLRTKIHRKREPICLFFSSELIDGLSLYVCFRNGGSTSGC